MTQSARNVVRPRCGPVSRLKHAGLTRRHAKRAYSRTATAPSSVVECFALCGHDASQTDVRQRLWNLRCGLRSVRGLKPLHARCTDATSGLRSRCSHRLVGGAGVGISLCGCARRQASMLPVRTDMPHDRAAAHTNSSSRVPICLQRSVSASIYPKAYYPLSRRNSSVSNGTIVNRSATQP